MNISNNIGADKDYQIIIASYTDDKFEGILHVTDKDTITAGSTEVFSKEFENVKTDKIKVFIWEGLDNMNPLTAALNLVPENLKGKTPDFQ